MTRWLLRVVLAAGIAWAGWWFVGSHLLEKSTRDWFAAQDNAQFSASYEELSVSGFPNRFDLTLSKPSFEGTGWRWSPEFLQLFSLSYKPWHLIVAFPETQVLAFGPQAFDLTAGKLQASAVLSPNLDLALERTALAGDNLLLSDPDGHARLRIGTLRAGSTLEEGNRHRLGVEAIDLRVISSLLQGDLHFERLRLDAGLVLSAPVDRHVAETGLEVEGLDLHEFSLHWGAVRLGTAGALSLSDEGLLNGRLQVTLENWSQGLARLAEMGVIDAKERDRLSGIVGLLALTSGSGSKLDLPVVLDDKGVSISGIRIAPPLYLDLPLIAPVQ